MMPIVRIFDNQWANTNAVGGVKHSVEVVGEEEREVTELTYFSGDRLAILITTTLLSDRAMLDLRRAVHREVIAALQNGRDAKTIQEIISNEPF